MINKRTNKSINTHYDQIKIIYEDKDFLIIDKPSGLLTHPVNRQDKSDSVVGWLLEKYPEIVRVRDQYGESVGSSSTSWEESKLVLDKWADLRPGIVHRLDRETSGLLLAAKTQTAFDYLKKLFAERKIKKTYLALVYGSLKKPSGVIETPLGKLGTRQTTRTYGRRRLQEKSAITEYKVLQEYTAPPPKLLNKKAYAFLFSNLSLLEVSPLTGRTHQIRIHLKSIGHPIVCDQLYRSKKFICPPELERLFLHAQKLSFVSPSGTAISVESDLPLELNNFLDGLQKTEK